MKADIKVNAHGHGTLSLDGHDISNGARGFALTGAVGEVTRLELDLVLLDTTEFSGEVHVTIPPATAELLERLGWTPPGGRP